MTRKKLKKKKQKPKKKKPGKRKKTVQKPSRRSPKLRSIERCDGPVENARSLAALYAERRQIDAKSGE